MFDIGSNLVLFVDDDIQCLVPDLVGQPRQIAQLQNSRLLDRHFQNHVDIVSGCQPRLGNKKWTADYQYFLLFEIQEHIESEQTRSNILQSVWQNSRLHVGHLMSVHDIRAVHFHTDND